MPSLIRAFSARKVLTERKRKAAAETDSRDEGVPQSGGRVLISVLSPILTPFPRAVMPPVCLSSYFWIVDFMSDIKNIP